MNSLLTMRKVAGLLLSLQFCLLAFAEEGSILKKPLAPLSSKDHKVFFAPGIRRISVSYGNKKNTHFGLSSNLGYQYTLPFSLTDLEVRPYFGLDWVRTNFFRGGYDFNKMTVIMNGVKGKVGLSTPLTQRASLDLDASYQVEEIFYRSFGGQVTYSFNPNKSLNLFSSLGYRRFITASSDINTSEINFSIGVGVCF